MKKYKITIANGDYPLSYTCDTISDAYGCLRSIAAWAPKQVHFRRDDLMETLVLMRMHKATGIKGDGYSITVLEEAD
ncbi:MAG: hypothetical protein KH284_02255 [Clostridiales bacterium]|nr:hypothetical protein [Clostridiales bacterium]